MASFVLCSVYSQAPPRFAKLFASLENNMRETSSVRQVAPPDYHARIGRGQKGPSRPAALGLLRGWARARKGARRSQTRSYAVHELCHSYPCPCPNQFVEPAELTNGYSMKFVELFWAGVRV